jgi:hypothetical protein
MLVEKLMGSSDPSRWRTNGGSGPRLQMSRGVYPIMKHANDRDAVIRNAKVNHMPLDVAATISLTNMITSWSGLRRFG